MERDSMTNTGHMIEIGVIRRTVKISEVGTILETIRIWVNIIEVKEETLRIDRLHDGCRGRDKDSRGRFRRNRRCSRSRNRGRSTSRDMDEEIRCHYSMEIRHFIRECQKKKRNLGKQGRQKAKMQ